MNPKRPYNTDVMAGSAMRIIFHKYVYADAFFAYCAEIQNFAQSGIWKERDIGVWRETKITKISFDFSQTVWFDTLGLCYLLMFAELASLKLGRDNIHFNFPENISEEDIAKTPNKFTLFHAFLLDNGFIAQMRRTGTVSNLDHVQEIPYSTIHSCIWPLQIIHESDEIKGSIEAIQKQLRNKFLQESNTEEQEYLLSKASYFLQETLDNAFKHGYEDNAEIKPCALLIKRVRSSDSLDRTQYQKTYLDHTPYLHISLYEEKMEYLEIYVADIGKGLRRSFLSDPFGRDKKITDENILEAILVKGKRSQRKMSRVKQSKYGGLYDIASIFRGDVDKLGFKGDSRWVFDNQRTGRISIQIPQHQYEGLVQGFSIIGNITVKRRQTDSYRLLHELRQVVDDNTDALYSEDNPWMRQNYREGIVVNDTRFCQLTSPEKTAQTAIIFPEKHLSKEQILKRLENHRDSITLIIAGIYEIECKKYRTMLESYTWDKDNPSQNQSVILLTNTLLPYVFTRTMQGFVYSEDATVHYIQHPPISKAENRLYHITTSYISFRLWKRVYDSEQMWEFMSQKNPMAYINAKIKWKNADIQQNNVNNQQSNSKKELDGYLDFSQLTLIPECRSLCIEQLMGFLMHHKKVYFCSLDRFTDEICEQANHIMDNSTESPKYWIGSVFVSGSSERKIDSESGNTKNRFYFFRHCNHHSEDAPVFSLFEWTTRKERIDQWFPPERYKDKEYSRVGNTSFLAKGGSEYWSSKHYRNGDRVYQILQSDIYHILQHQFGARPPVIKVGHFDAIDHHDLFEIKADAIVDTDIIAKQMAQTQNCNSYDFLLTKFLLALNSSPRLDEPSRYFRGDASAPSLNAIRHSMVASAQHSVGRGKHGLIVYLTDYQTSRIIETVKAVFSEELQARIIPIIPIERNYTSSTLLISPLLLDSLEEKIIYAREHNRVICGDNTVVVTLFIATSFTTRLQEELRHIIMCMGARQVNILSLIDRQRMPFGRYCTEANMAFTRLDIPAIGFPDTCPICTALNTLSNLCTELRNPILKDRVDKITAQWKAIKSSDNHFGKGISPCHINLPQEVRESLKMHTQDYEQGDIEITTDLGLVMFSIENTVISLSSGFLEACINSGLDSSVKLLLLSAHLLTFSDLQLSENFFCKMIEKLCTILQEEKNTSEYTGLAVIALCGQPARFLQVAQTCFEKHAKTECHSKNNDALLLRLAVYVKLRSTVDYSAPVEYRRELHCYLRNESNALELIYDLFLYSEPEYRQSHRQAFGVIMASGRKQTNEDYYRVAQKYTQKMSDIFSESQMKNLYYDAERYESRREEIVSGLGILEGLLDEVKTDKDHQAVKAALTSTLAIIQEVNKGIYLRRPRSGQKEDIEAWLDYCIAVAHKRSPRKDMIIEMIISTVQKSSRKNGSATAKGISEFRPRFYVHADVTEEVINLIVDIIVHSSCRLQNFFQSEQDKFKDGADGIITVDFFDCHVELNFYNATGKTKRIEEIREIKQSKYNRPSMLTFRQFEERLSHSGGSDRIACFDWNYCEKYHSEFCLDKSENESNHLFCATMIIPYIDQGSEFGNR